MSPVHPPRIAVCALRKIATPTPLQARILAEYARMNFAPVGGEATYDEEYGARQRGGISASGTPGMRRSPPPPGIVR